MARVSVALASSVAAPLLLALAVSGPAVAADQKAVLEKIKAHNQAATSAFGASDFDEMKSRLLEAIALGNENGLSRSKVLAQTYVLMGVLQVDGFKDADAGVRFFAKAIDISPAIQIPDGMATKAVKKAWKRAEDEDPVEAAEEQEEKPKAPSAAEKRRAEADAAAEKKRADAESAAEKKRADAESAAEKKRIEAEYAAEKKRSDAEARERDKQEKLDRQERERLTAELAQAKVTESLGQAEKEKLQHERQEKDKALSDSKGRIALLEKDRAEKDKALSDAKGRITLLEKDKADRDKALADAKGRIALLEKDKADRDKTIAATKDSEAKERAAKEKLEKELPDREKALADAKARIALLEKDKADRDKWLAATKDSEAKERASKEKLEKELQEIAARDKERKAKEDEERREREKEEAGPDLPGHIGEPITCTMPDEIAAGEDLFVHCVPQPGLGAKVLAFYFRPGGSVVYNAITMERTKKGWYVAMVPGPRIYGRLFQYYVEARDAKQGIAANNGKASSPNIATVRSGAIAHKGKR